MTTLHTIEQRLSGPLPGAAAHAQMAPTPALPPVTGEAREAAVLLLLSPAAYRFPSRVRDLFMTLIRRSDVGEHSHELAFPGGFMLDGESTDNAALREAREEIALDTSRVRVLGHLTPVRTATSNAVIRPVLGLMRYFPELSPNGEVDSIVHVPLRALMRPNARGIKVVHDDRLGRRRIPYFLVGKEELWGASAKIMAELLALLGQDSG